MNIGIIPCDNGLGHISRSIELANFLIKKFRVTLYISKELNNFKINKKVSLIKVESNFQLKNCNYNVNWYKKIKKINFKELDILISDNLPEAIFLHKKTIIYANFFWHEILNKEKYFSYLLKKKIIDDNIKIITNYMFGNINSLKKNISKIGFIGKYTNQKISKKKGILISFGTSKIDYKKNCQSILNTLQNQVFKDYIFYLDKNLFSKKNNVFKNIRVADFSNKMFKNIKIALIKPGLGTIIDCLKRGIAINCFLQSNNKEFLNNAKILKSKKIGNYFYNFDNALANTLKKFDNNKELLKIQNICKNLKWTGDKDFQENILKTINIEK